MLFKNGTDEQKQWAATLVERGWGATMVLTEPDAGSDVGAGRTKAVQQDDGTWHIEGVKRFITSATSDDLFENIFPGPGPSRGRRPGHQGLSLFFVPKFHFDFERTSWASATASSSPTSSTRWASRRPRPVSSPSAATAPRRRLAVGEVHNGIAQMFDVIEHARMMVGTKAISTLSTATSTHSTTPSSASRART